ncbi:MULTISPECIES: glycosyltransferase family 2 protein [unclassified Streptomyces]|uniref:glycosyltransferase n=1 Tax=unclassified Streptomyces TaxID=2593676 RepID=UPI000F4F60C9|nr:MULTISPECIES: glycosyltransferase family 2 protein [unclassified Streptomyces]MDH6454663.1 glycosyltransferase involved in cell wall biosynthesis [Streptomyces sp. SAI-119]MDH6494779.1 glycosyltransferase involved in cell wall biosynthesis [Streptomyces sp. SAI-149]QUC58102.1 glycosyltransferase family 2 protein [Streptomyces sp. A2-16]
MTSIVIPAHNEAQVIGRLLDSLLADSPEDETDIVVVCNGCTDDTARIAADRGPRVRVVEIPVPSKHAALRAGDDHARGFPRLYVDADVVLGSADVRALTEPLDDDTSGILATAPERQIPLAACAWRVRAYYRVWQRLPAVREGLFGRGVIAVSKAGHARITALPPLMADDLAASLAFAPEERRVVDTARVVVQPPRTWPDLIKRRIRAAVSTAQVEQQHRSPQEATARTGKADLIALVRAEPSLVTGVVVFVAAAVVARRGAAKAIRAQDFGTWLRDESSREN